MSEELKPCPFCGSQGEVHQTHKLHFVVRCTNDACQCQIMPERSHLAAKTVWDERFTPPTANDRKEGDTKCAAPVENLAGHAKSTESIKAASSGAIESPTPSISASVQKLIERLPRGVSGQQLYCFDKPEMEQIIVALLEWDRPTPAPSASVEQIARQVAGEFRLFCAREGIELPHHAEVRLKSIWANSITAAVAENGIQPALNMTRQIQQTIAAEVAAALAPLQAEIDDARARADCGPNCTLASAIEGNKMALAQMGAELEQAKAFKDFMHRRLDSAGVPKEFPDGKHTKEGCRIGDRLDWVLERSAELEQAKEDKRKMTQEHKELVDIWFDCSTLLGMPGGSIYPTGLKPAISDLQSRLATAEAALRSAKTILAPSDIPLHIATVKKIDAALPDKAKGAQ